MIAAAGRGTRFLPYTKALPKEMLPIINKPVIQLIVEDLVAAGVEEIIIVLSNNKQVIKDHFDHHEAVEEYLKNQEGAKAVQELAALSELAKFTYVIQKSASGSASPLIDAIHLLGDQPFFYCFADDFFKSQIPATKQLMRVFEQIDQPLVALHRPQQHALAQYGIVEIDRRLEANLIKVNQIVEKPPIKQAPSALAVAGCFLLTAAILPLLPEIKPSQNGELAITDILNMLPEIYGLEIDGIYCDVGTPEAYLQSLTRAALNDPDYGSDFKRFLQSITHE